METKSFKLATYSKGAEDSTRLALVLPGRLDTKDYPHTRSHVDFLAKLGYFALAFDPPGTWESPGDIELYKMTNYLKAINELVEHFGNKPTFVMGHSRGGSMAMLAGITNPSVNQFAAVMSRATASTPDKGTKSGDTQTEYRDVPGRSEEKKRFELPFSYFEDAAQYNMLDGLKKCIKPKLFVLGTQDVMVKPEAVREAFEAAAEPKELQSLDSEHDYRRHPNLIEEVNQVIDKFLRQYPSPRV